MEINRELAAKVLEVVDAGLCHGMGKPAPGQMCVEAAVCYAMGLPHGDEPICVSPALRQLKISINDRAWSSNAARAKGLRRLAIAQLGSKGELNDIEFAKRVATLAIQKCVPAALRVAASIQKDQKHREAMIAAAFKCEAEPTRANAIEAKETAYAAADAAAANANAAAANANADAAAAAAAAANAYAAANANAAAAAANANAAAAAANANAAAAAANANANAAAANANANAYAAAANANANAYAAAAAANAANAAANANAYADADAARDKSLAEFAEDVVQILIDMKAPGCEWLSLTEAA